MNLKPEKVGNCVKIGSVIFPAEKIQVDNLPSFVTSTLYTWNYKPLYFEIKFNDQTVWVVEQWFDLIMVSEYQRGLSHIWGMPIVTAQHVDSWAEFLILYEDKIRVVSLL